MSNVFQKYKEITFLIVDDFSEFRLSLKQMVESFGANTIDVCIDADSAIERYSEQYHDVLLVDYNLGDGLTGLQLLEELNHRKLLKAGTSFVLITGETAMDLVMGALEYRPDDYLAKPFTRTTLKQRIDKLVELNLQLKPIFHEVNNGKPNKAIAMCDQIMQQNRRVALTCMRIKAELLLKETRYVDAASVYQTVIAKKELNWALMGFANCLNGMNKLSDAILVCQNIINRNKNALEAFDLLAECYINTGDYDGAFSTVKMAAERSPNSIPRQRMQAKLALRYHDYELAFNSTKKLIQLAKHSCLILVEDYINQLIICSTIHYCSGSALSRRAAKEYNTTYRELNKRFNSVQSALCIEIHKSFCNFKANKENRSELQQNLLRAKNLPDPQQSYLVDLINFIIKACEDSEIAELANDVIALSNTQLFTQNNMQKSDDYNRQGMVKYKQKSYPEAVAAFKTALTNSPDNPNIALNLLQSYYKQLKESTTTTHDNTIYRLCHRALQKLPPSDHRYNQSQVLLAHVKAIIKGIS